MKKPSNRRMEIVRRLMELEFMEDASFSNTTVMEDIKKEMKEEQEHNSKKLHELRLKKSLLKNNISPKKDDPKP